MVKSTLALLTAAVATVSVNAAVAPRPRANVGPMQPPMGQVQDYGRYAPLRRPAFNRRFAAPAYRKRADEEEEEAPPADDESAQAVDAPADGSDAGDESAQTVDAPADGSNAGNETDDRWWYGYYGYRYPYYGYRYPYYGYPYYGYYW
ncbi:hypothetical protein AX774_g2535 [Zancudomyces culisetae]|uniref:Uncharacterized protein n=1 Tax=Zancudomyces culisetae TaxID=1213189 RepID=A0A1R1PSL5_ZANCU|nr:hypothetical protein AX774_g2535 [Zancudomyces culisetae]|eukprot:OMH83957.1 hypothetical protein AX774_g2535 [Zancudomyces culisetae]